MHLLNSKLNKLGRNFQKMSMNLLEIKSETKITKTAKDYTVHRQLDMLEKLYKTATLGCFIESKNE